MADLTVGDTSLTKKDPFTVSGAFGTDNFTLGLGKRYDGNENAFPGSIDEINMYSAALSQADFQTNC